MAKCSGCIGHVYRTAKFWVDHLPSSKWAAGDKIVEDVFRHYSTTRCSHPMKVTYISFDLRRDRFARTFRDDKDKARKYSSRLRNNFIQIQRDYENRWRCVKVYTEFLPNYTALKCLHVTFSILELCRLAHAKTIFQYFQVLNNLIISY